jgi:hypothetical protein
MRRLAYQLRLLLVQYLLLLIVRIAPPTSEGILVVDGVLLICMKMKERFEAEVVAG